MDKIGKETIQGQFLNVQKAAAFLDVNPTTIRRWAQMGKLTGVKIGSRGDWRFTQDNLLLMTRKV